MIAIASRGCILSKFHIKPQQRLRHRLGHSVVSYRNSTSNHNIISFVRTILLLYLIEIPHQTTTRVVSLCVERLLYLIEIPHQTTTLLQHRRYTRKLYLIEIPHQTTTPASALMLRCRCILSKFHIKPQPLPSLVLWLLVVSYRNSTSNHNFSMKNV